MDTKVKKKGGGTYGPIAEVVQVDQVWASILVGEMGQTFVEKARDLWH